MAIGARRSRIVAALGAALLVAGVVAVPIAPATAALNVPQPANGEGELVDTYTTRDAVFAWMLSDIAGGRICIVASSGSGDCDAPAWGTPNHVVNVGSTFTLLEGPSLVPGQWRLLTESPSGNQWIENDYSEVFTVEPCVPGVCNTTIGAEQAQNFKDSAAGPWAMSAATCVGVQVTTAATNGLAIGTATTKKVGLAVAGASAVSSSVVPTSPMEHFLGGLACNMQKVYQDIRNDPPDPNYAATVYPSESVPVGTFASPVIEEFHRALEHERAYAKATLTAYERYQGAAIDAELAHETSQASSTADYAGTLVDARRRTITAIGALLASADPADVAFVGHTPFPTAGDASAYYAFVDRVAASGFTSTEVDVLTTSGLSNAEIDEVRAALTRHADTEIADGQSLGALLSARLTELEDSIAPLDLFERDARNAADGLAALNLPGRDDEVASVEIEASETDLEVGEEVCFSALPYDDDGDTLGGGPFSVGTTSTGYLELDLVQPNLYNHYGDIMNQCLTVSEPASVTMTIHMGTDLAFSDSVTVTWSEPPPGNHEPWVAATSAETPPGAAIPITLIGGDSDGDELTWTVESPSHGELTGTAPYLTYTPDAGFEGWESLTFRATDGQGYSGWADLTIGVVEDASNPMLPVIATTVPDYLRNSAYRQRVPDSLAGLDIIDVAGGGQQGSFALEDNGTIHAWGGYDWMSGPSVTPERVESYWKVPGELSEADVQAIDSNGNGMHIAQRADGTLEGWGMCGDHVPTVLHTTPVAAFGSAWGGGIALTNAGTVVPWHSSYVDYGEGGGTDVFGNPCFVAIQDVPEQVSSASVTDVAAGGFGFLAQTSPNTVHTWDRSRGSAGGSNGWFGSFSLTTRTVADLSGDDYRGVLLTSDTGKLTLWSWGLSGMHNNAGLGRLTSDAVNEVKVSNGAMIATTRDGELRVDLRFEQSTDHYYPGSYTGGLPQAALNRRVTDVSSAFLGSLALAPLPDVRRLAGANRYATGVEITRDGFEPGIPVVYVATGQNFPDALSAGPAAAAQGGALLLVTRDAIPPLVAAELARLDPERIVVVGATSSVSSAVYTQLRGYVDSASDIRRDAGANRYETSKIVTERAFETADVVYAATGQTFPDALSASAAAAHRNAPVVLVPGLADALPAATSALVDSLGADRVYVTGSYLTVSTGIEDDLDSIPGVDTVRLAGANRYETSVAINREAFGSSESIFVATGAGFADALAGGALAGSYGAPLYVTRTMCMTPGILEDIFDLRTIDIVLLGGEPSLSLAVEDLQSC